MTCLPAAVHFATGAFTEGWAFYAEQLADELGLYPTPRERAAYLLHQVDGWLGMMVDPAVHVGGWSRDVAADTIQWWAGKPRDVALLYADRHAASPAQLVSYMAGYRELVALRERARRALGDRFDLRAFHDVVLRDGSIPLRMVGENVDRWIAERARR